MYENVTLPDCDKKKSLSQWILKCAKSDLKLTKSKKHPKAKQKTKGPARSVSSNISLLGVRNGFKTERVCWNEKKNNSVD